MGIHCRKFLRRNFSKYFKKAHKYYVFLWKTISGNFLLAWEFFWNVLHSFVSTEFLQNFSAHCLPGIIFSIFCWIFLSICHCFLLLENRRYAKMWYKGISFTSENCALIYLVDSAGTRTTTDAFSDMTKDYTLSVFLK